MHTKHIINQGESKKQQMITLKKNKSFNPGLKGHGVGDNQEFEEGH